jgi:hypothetical protein
MRGGHEGKNDYGKNDRDQLATTNGVGYLIIGAGLRLETLSSHRTST